ncbi:UDP-2,3-diacylglucosamine hydrolase [Helicobacter sp. L8]|uniref:UDP-2,3-diacylglucosamine hydrolase n=1 Tax=Helicobacter sp. L8 TaxID=2316078 RepID=UPI000EAC2A4C|nr:UDP-2,3-diacylglucosamine hydrolase [Helicobacter sp. L8]
MSASFPSLSSDALFIADAHHKPDSPAFALLVDQLLKTPPKQVFLMGDIFHILVGQVTSTLKPHRAMLDKIHALSQITQVFYFEGNHDLALSALKALQRTEIYPRSRQPAFFRYKERLFSLAHGDLFVGRGYEIYIRLLKHSCALLGYLDKVLARAYPYIQKPLDAKYIKTLDLDMPSLASFAKARLALHALHAQSKGIERLGGVIEGHFHVGKCYYHTQSAQVYYGLPCFYHTQSAPTLQTCMPKI